MTERSEDASVPTGAAGAAAAGPGRPTAACWDLAAVRRSDAIVEALAARDALPDSGAADPADPAVALLRALIADVDAGAFDPSLPRRPAPPAQQSTRPGKRRPGSGGRMRPVPAEGDGTAAEPGPRRGPRKVVLLGVVGPLLTGVLATTGVAVAQDGPAEQPGSAPGAGELAAGEPAAHARIRLVRERPDTARPAEGVITVLAADGGPMRSLPFRTPMPDLRVEPHEDRLPKDRAGEDRRGSGERRAPRAQPEAPGGDAPKPRQDLLPFADPEPGEPHADQDRLDPSEPAPDNTEERPAAPPPADETDGGLPEET